MDDYRKAPLEPEMKQLLSFAEKVARDAGEMTPDDIAKLRSAGFSDRALLDAAHVAGFFSYMNRVVQALGADGKASIGATQRCTGKNQPLDLARFEFSRQAVRAALVAFLIVKPYHRGRGLRHDMVLWIWPDRIVHT